MNEELNPSQQEEKQEESFDVVAFLQKYLAYWHWFVIGVVAMVVVVYAWLRFQTPIYNVSAAVLIKEDDKNSNINNSPLSAIQDLGMFSMTNNFDNEVEILHSRTLVKKVVTTLNLYSSLAQKRMLGYDVSLYKDAPLKLFMTPEEAEKLKAPVVMDLKLTPEYKLDVELKYRVDPKADEETITKSFDKLPAVITTPVGTVTLIQNDSVKMEKTMNLKGVIANPAAVAKGYAASLTVEATSKTTTIAQLSLKNSNTARAVDFINCLVNLYNKDANDEKNQVAEKTAEFIEERLHIINGELGTTENELAAFKQRSGLTDLESDAKLALEENSKYNQQRVENETQISLVRFLRDYINNPANKNEVIPANVGLTDQTLSNAIIQYNTMVGDRKRLALTSSDENPAVKQLNISLEAMRSSVQTTVNSVLDGLLITQKELDRQARKFEGRISDAPRQEKEFMSISRQQEIKAALYVMLLQKREENAITLAATANNGRIIEEALADSAPVAPKKMMFLLAALVLGVGIPFGILYLRDLFRYKIESREDIEKITTTPIIGEITLSHDAGTDGSSIVVRENRNDLMEETFRALRTNLLFTMHSGEKVIMISSTMPGEGKSFIGGNLAVSLALMGKKTIIVGMDVRKPVLDRVFGLPHGHAGVTAYLSDPEHTDVWKLIQHSSISSNLDIFPAGAIPPNPTELVARPSLEDLIDLLKSRYDYILLDSAPIASVTDSMIISRVADALVYVCRADYTPKSGYAYINVLRSENKVKNISTVLNGIDMSLRKNSYSYGYGRYGYGHYGYGHKYGYGYGYGHDYGKEKKK